MNERIRELYEQARLQAKSIDADLDRQGWMDLYHQKFAELIVQECAETVQDFVDHRFPASEYPVRLRRYFGVEE
jgi:hypothetical protein